MTMMKILLTLSLLLLTAASKKKMNVLLFSVDDLRPQLDCTDAPGTVRPKMVTPNIDALCDKSLVLLRSQVAMATCSPSRTAMLTGRHVGRTHVWDLYSYFRNVTGNLTTIPQYFKEKNYKTKGMGKIFHPGVASGATSGSKYPCKVCQGEDDGNYSWSEPYFHAISPLDNDKEASWIAVPSNVTEKTPLQDTLIADEAVRSLGEFAKDKENPFFLAVGFHKPHLPFVFPERFLEMYPENEIRLPENNYAPYDMPEIAWQNFGETRGYQDIAALHATGAPNTSLPNATILELRRAYYSAVSYTDYNIGRVMKSLSDNGLDDSTIILFWGDHGWTLGEHSEFDKHTNWNIATHAPVMLHVPGLTDHGIRTYQVTETVDIFPSLVDFALQETIPSCSENESMMLTCTDGKSVRPLIDNPDSALKLSALSAYDRGIPKDFEAAAAAASAGPKMSNCLLGHGNGCAMGYSMLTHLDGHEIRYTEWVHYPGPSKNFKPDWSTNYGTEFYNHTESPGENVNRFRWIENTDIHDTLSKRLHDKVSVNS